MLLIRFLLGNLATLGSPSQLPERSQLAPLDRLTLHRAAVFAGDVFDLYEKLQPNLVVLRVLNFVANDLSSDYFGLVKDR